jgi:hypothetical protein
MDLELRYTKWDGRPHWRYTLHDLGTDRFGRWLVAWSGEPSQRGSEPAIVREYDTVVLIPADGNWIGHWNALDPLEIYVDVTTRPVIDGGAIHAVDVDLDVVRWRADQRVEVLDEDEFAEHQVAMSYPRDLIDATRATTRWLVEALTARAEPFGDVGDGWLARLRADAAQ